MKRKSNGLSSWGGSPVGPTSRHDPLRPHYWTYWDYMAGFVRLHHSQLSTVKGRVSGGCAPSWLGSTSPLKGDRDEKPSNSP